MTTPEHAAPIGTILDPAYFSPGCYQFNGETIGSLWAIAFFAGQEFRYERTALGQPWVRVA